MLERGQSEAGVARIHQAYVGLMATGSRLFLPHLSVWLAEGYAAQGQITEALNVSAEVFEFVARTDDRWWEAEMYRLKGELVRKGQGGSLRVKEAAAAEACFLKAIEVARRQ